MFVQMSEDGWCKGFLPGVLTALAALELQVFSNSSGSAYWLAAANKTTATILPKSVYPWEGAGESIETPVLAVSEAVMSARPALAMPGACLQPCLPSHHPL